MKKDSGNSEVNQSSIVVRRKSSSEALGGANVIGNDWSADSECSRDSDDSSSESSSDGEVGTKPHSDDRTDLSKKRCGIRSPSLQLVGNLSPGRKK